MLKKFTVLLSASLFLFSDEAPSYWDFHPLHAGGNAIALGSAEVDLRDGQKMGQLQFDKVNAFAYIIVPISRESYFLPRVEWNAFRMDWNENPRFQEKHFEFIQFALTFLSIAVEKWRWIARVDANFDVSHFSEFHKYGLFSALLWGTNDIGEKWRYHVGAVGYTGIRGETVYPIIGFDYIFNKKWMFQAVFPISYALEYSPTKEWRLSARGRPLKERFRTDSQSIFCYSTMGLEFNVHYEKFLRCEVEFFAGCSFGGSFYIKDGNGQNPLYTSIQKAPYGGASLNWGF